ncbi:MAG TPA: hypothetical protein VFV67_21730 [Actinophytocola sp.]|uniref:hypothetical protein n=1 Tax=Actinophytocola sp. TaxID=1872138 RepID=UPI002DBCD4EE|nr:hypothetical protein [Actinophytocola sp.]HEU5473274.1 hypothetical protein [Actinophytocola sp.]
MAEHNRALVLHVTGATEPLVFALSESGAKKLAPRLGPLLNSGGVDTPELADGSTVAINFGHVVSAHLDDLPPLGRVYGSVTHRRHGFAK